MSKFECIGCNRHHVIESAEKPVFCLMTVERPNWREVAADMPPKLTAEELARRGIEWPEGSNVAVVATIEGTGLFAKTATMDDSEEHWNCNEPVSLIPGKWDASDWKNSLIQRPEALPNWCKVGAWVWYCGHGGSYDVVEKIQYGLAYLRGTMCNIDPDNLREARLIMWSKSEWERKIGQKFQLSEGQFLLLGVADHDDGFYLEFSTCSGTLESLMGKEDNLRNIDGSPCGFLEHREGDGWVR